MPTAPPRDSSRRPPTGAARSAWVALAGAVLLQGATAPGQTVGVSVFVDHLATGLDLSRSAVSAAYLVGTLAGAFTLPAAGRLIDRRGVRVATLLFGTGFGAALLAMGAVTGFATLAVGFAATRILGQGALTLTATTTVAVWFRERRGTANGIKTAVGSGLMALVPIGSAALISAIGWRRAWVVLGLLAWTVVLPLGRWVIRDPRRPARSGEEAGAGGHPPLQPSWPVGAVVRHPAFLAMTAAVALSALVSTGLMFHHIDLLTGRGLTTTEAAAAFLPLTLASAGGALAIGPLADRIAPRYLAAVALLALAAAPVLVQSIGGAVSAAVYGAVLGAAGASIRTLEATALPRWFGIASIGQIRGVSLAAGVGASALGPLAISASFDFLGGYGPSLDLLAISAAGLAVVTALVRPPDHGMSDTARAS
ncbi:MAG: MFS transporter [Acidimicrobiales bacterium]|nr:MFS transporter [Acidimicrobiales bacterium]